MSEINFRRSINTVYTAPDFNFQFHFSQKRTPALASIFVVDQRRYDSNYGTCANNCVNSCYGAGNSPEMRTSRMRVDLDGSLWLKMIFGQIHSRAKLNNEYSGWVAEKDLVGRVLGTPVLKHPCLGFLQNRLKSRFFRQLKKSSRSRSSSSDAINNSESMPDLGHFNTGSKLNMGELDLASLNLNELQDNSTSSAESSANNSLREDAKKKRKKIKHRRSISSSLVFAKLLQNQNRKDSFDDVFIQGEFGSHKNLQGTGIHRKSCLSDIYSTENPLDVSLKAPSTVSTKRNTMG